MLSIALGVATIPLRSAEPPAGLNVDLGGGVTMELVLIPAGSFVMGSPPELGDGDEGPQHNVTLTRSFYLGKHEVTQAQWQQLMDSNPSHFKGAQRPVDTVSWDDCQRFLGKAAEKSGRKFSLPTEAQWEYACRAGTTTHWSFGSKAEAGREFAWMAPNSGGVTHPVGEKKPNAWGVHDLHGNIAEWCADRYANPYPKGDATDPIGSATGEARVVRGGAWGDHAENIRSAYRSCNGADGAHDGIGFRCVILMENVSP